MTPRATFTDSRDTFEAALNSLFSGDPNDTERDLAALLVPEFTLRADDASFDFAGFVTHIRWLREHVPSVTLSMVQFVREGKQLADRHIGKTRMEDGTVRRSETFMFVEVADDGRLFSIIESVRQIRE